MEDYRETERRRNGGTVFNEPYNESAIYRFKQLVQKFYEQNERKFYSILVDGETVVKKTSDSRKFDGYQDFINDYTKKVEVRIFINEHPNSPNCNRYIFRMGGTLAGVPNPVDVKAEIKKALKKQRQENEIINLKKKVVQLQKELERAPKVDWDKIAEKGLGVLAMIKGSGNQLNGIARDQHQESEVIVEVESQTSSELKTGQLLYNALLEKHGVDKIIKAIETIGVIASNPDIRDKVNEMLNDKK